MDRAPLARLLVELRASPSPLDGQDALARLRFTTREADAELVSLVGEGLEAGKLVAMISEQGERPEERALTELTAARATVVSVARGVYGHIPTRAARVELIGKARRAARVAVVLHVTVSDDGSHLGRAVVDAPRRVLRAARMTDAEPGDRFGPDRFSHCFFDEESLRSELAEAGLVITRRRGFTFVLRAHVGEDAAPELPAPFALELARVTRIVRRMDDARKNEPPARAIASARARGRQAPRRGPLGRARLLRAIGWVDALMPGGASCYRRILLEVALDAGAAGETVVFGLDVGRTGHVAFENREERAFDVSFAIPPE